MTANSNTNINGTPPTEPNLDALADDFLDGALTDREWDAIVRHHDRAALHALGQAELRRASIAALPRGDLPMALRDRLVLQVPTPRPMATTHGWWRAMQLVAAASVVVGLTFAVLRSSADGPAPTSPLAETSSAPMQLAKRERAEPAAMAMPAASNEHAAEADHDDRPALADRQMARAAVQAPAAVTAALSATVQPAARGIPGPHAIAIAWSDEPGAFGGELGASLSNEGLAHAELADVAREPESQTAAPAQAAGPRTGAKTAVASPATEEAAAGSPEVANGLQAKAKERADVAPAKKTPAADELTGRTLIVVLHNRTITPWQITAASLRIEARDAQGVTVWQGRPAAVGTINVAAGGFAHVSVAVDGLPPAAVTIQAQVEALQSTAMPLIQR